MKKTKIIFYSEIVRTSIKHHKLTLLLYQHRNVHPNLFLDSLLTSSLVSSTDQFRIHAAPAQRKCLPACPVRPISPNVQSARRTRLSVTQSLLWGVHLAPE